MALRSGAVLHFAKGHGTENDFVVLPDLDGVLDLTPSLVRALCDRRGGIGADGVLRVVPAARVPGCEATSGAGWFMDYRNADGSVAEMCGNGIRVYARYLVESGLAGPGALRLATRDGVKQVRLAATGDVTVEMGSARALGASTVVLGGRACAGVHVDMGNPHLVCTVDDDLRSWDLSRPPAVDGATFPDGVNVEIVVRRGERHVAMRVYERGVGETRSCGTGACAVAVATSASISSADPSADTPADPRAEVPAEARWTVDVPGGRLTVDLELGGGAVRLAGPAVIVATGVLDDGWLAATASDAYLK